MKILESKIYRLGFPPSIFASEVPTNVVDESVNNEDVINVVNEKDELVGYWEKLRTRHVWVWREKDYVSIGEI